MGQFFVSTVDKVLEVPKIKRSFSNKEDWKFELKAGKAVPIGDDVAEGEIPMEVAKTYKDCYPHVYSIVDDGEEVVSTTEDKPQVTPGPPAEFDPVQFLAEHPEPTEEGLALIKQRQLLAICEVLELTGSVTESKLVLAGKIVQELKVRMEKEKSQGE